MDMADRHAGRIEDTHAISSGAHAPPAPQISIDIDPQPVGRDAWLGVDEDSPASNPGAFDNIEGIEATWIAS
jgi:hypothetical protein